MAVAVLAACGGGDGDDGATTATRTTATTTETETETTTLRMYFVRAELVGVSTREVERTTVVAAAALRELLAGPSAEERAGGLGTAIPEGTQLRSVVISGRTATVDLSRAFEAGGGSTSMTLRVAQVVHTLTQFPTVARVAFRLDGEAVESIGGEGVVVSPAVDRGDFESQAPAILVESVGPGDVISSPVRLTGTANTFEATLNLRLVGADGEVLHDDFATATSGSGMRGTFDETIEFDGEGPATLVAYERSGEDGSEINVVEIPVVLRR
ncbi:MAG TPA: GerMN domain-containing protein [Gaiellaceae bacterium]|nr:GerMN domain-containing protein [Gaiellaceae bacterium]